MVSMKFGKIMVLVRAAGGCSIQKNSFLQKFDFDLYSAPEMDECNSCSSWTMQPLSPPKTQFHPLTKPTPTPPPNPWRLCTVTQVEEAKCMFRVLPIWLCTVTFSGIFVQMYYLFAEQGASMRTTTIHNFHIPPASMFIFDIISVSTFIIFYERLIAPLYIKITKTVSKGPSDLRKMGYSLIFVMAAMSTAGFVEIQRKKYAGEGSEELSSLFIQWQVPQYVLLGVGEAFVYVGQFDFFGHQVPDVMRSLGIALSLSLYSIGSYLCSLLLSVVMKITTKGGRAGWVPLNLNDGFLERYFFLMSALGVLELALYVWCAQCYKAISLVAREVTRRENGAP